MCREGTYDVILSTNADAIRKQMDNVGIKYWEASGVENNYFTQDKVRKEVDEKLLDKYLSLSFYKGKPCKEKIGFERIFFRTRINGLSWQWKQGIRKRFRIF